MGSSAQLVLIMLVMVLPVNALRAVASRRAVAFVGFCAASAPSACRAVDGAASAGDCDDCKLESAAVPSTQRFQRGDVISLDDGASQSSPVPSRPPAGQMGAGLPNPQLEAKKALYRLAAGDYDAQATQAKLRAMIETTPCLMFSLST